MEQSDKTARQLFEHVQANPTRKRFGFGKVPALINIDLQKAYTCVGEFATAYETDPKQLHYVNQLAEVFRSKGFPLCGPMWLTWTLAKTAVSGVHAPTHPTLCKISKWGAAVQSLTIAW